MADVFISYASEDRDIVRTFVAHIEKAGLSVWWDRNIGVGTSFDLEIERELDACGCVVVVWSRYSVSSDWVRAEAMEGLERNILVPLAMDDSRIPLAFRRVQTANLSDPDTRQAVLSAQVIPAVRLCVEQSAQSAATFPPQTAFTQSGDLTIAYQTYGEGERDLVVVPGWVSNVELFWEHDDVRDFFAGLGKFARVILFDKRGTGMSDRNCPEATLEERADDLRAVMDAVGSKRATLFGYSEGGPMCCWFATAFAERTEGLILVGSYATIQPRPGHPFGRDAQTQQAMVNATKRDWGSAVLLETRAPSVADDEAFARWWKRYLRMSASPASAVALTEMAYDIDVRSILPEIRVPTLIMHADKDLSVPYACGKFLTEHIPGATFVTLDTQDHLPYVGAPEAIRQGIQEFLNRSG